MSPDDFLAALDDYMDARARLDEYCEENTCEAGTEQLLNYRSCRNRILKMLAEIIPNPKTV